jgi:lysophospholipase L1-like esterase
MTYVEQTWEDENISYPASAARMQHIETGLAAVSNGGSSSPKPTIVLLGDSITTRNQLSNDSTHISHDTRGYWTWAGVFLGQRIAPLNFAGVAGERTDQILLRVQSGALAYNPGWVLVQAGVNDVAQSVASSTVIANLTAIYTAILATGARVVATTITPNNANTSAQNLIRSQVNEWMRAYAALTPGIVLCDWASAVTATNTQNWIGSPSMSPDGEHPNTYGAARMGRMLANTLAPFLAGSPAIGLPVANLDATNAVQNSFFDASLIAQWTFGGTSTNSQVARSDEIAGNWEQMVTASATLAYARYLISSPSTYFTLGADLVYCVAEVQSDAWVAASQLELDVVFRDSSNATIIEGYDMWNSQGDVFPLENQPGYENGATKTHVLRTPAIVIPSNCASIFAQAQFTGQGNVRWGRIACRKLAAPMTVLA